MSNLQLWSAFVGIVLPNVVSLVNQAHWPSWLKGAVAVVACAIAAIITTDLQGGFHGRSFATSFLIVLSATLATYRVFWKPTGISDKIEYSTTLHKQQPTAETAPAA
jgi:hypothetical protein